MSQRKEVSDMKKNVGKQRNDVRAERVRRMVFRADRGRGMRLRAEKVRESIV